MYYRYFRIKDESTLNAIAAYWEQRRAFIEDIPAILKEFGASNIFSGHGGGISGFMFDGEPDKKIWKLVKGTSRWIPKETKAGKEAASRISKLKSPGEIDLCLKKANLDYFFCLTDGNKAYSAGITGSAEIGWFATVPWKSVDPVELEQYKIDNAAGTHFSHDLSHLLWEAPKEWEEIKKWEYLRDMESLKKDGEQAA